MMREETNISPEFTGCPVGTHLLPTNREPPVCEVCPAGFSCGTEGVKRCNIGTYSRTGSGICSPCPEDTTCSDPTKPPTRCPFGWHRRGDAAECTPCPAGKMCQNWTSLAMRGENDVPCPLGTYTNASKPGICIPCPPGFYCPDPSAAPRRCPAGTSSQGGMRKCSSAPEGLVIIQGKEHLPARPCEEGLLPIEIQGQWFCGTDFENETLARERRSRAVRSSPASNISAVGELTFPDMCDGGRLKPTYCQFREYPIDSWCPSLESGLQRYPEEFKKGFYRPRGGLLSQFFVSCGYAHRRSVAHEKDNCESMVASNPFLGTTSTKATLCIIGRVCGTSKFRDIQKGYFQLSWYGGVASPKQTDFPGEYKCWEGYICKGKHHWPWPCPPGTYGKDDGKACISCPAGWPCPISHTTRNQLVVACWPGHYCPEGSASPTAKACPKGTVNHNAAAKDATACKPCPAGWLCSTRAFQRIGVQACPSGHYCTEGAHESTPCPAGTYTPYPGDSDRMTSEDKCVPCVAGYYCLEGNSLLDMLAQPCPAGRVCPAGTSSAKGPKCSPGFYSPVSGLTQQSECLPCESD